MERMRDVNGHIDLGTVHRERKTMEQKVKEMEMQQNVLKAEHKRMLDEIKAAKEKEIRFRKQNDILFGQSRKLQDRTLELKEECEAYQNRSEQNEEATAASSGPVLIEHRIMHFHQSPQMRIFHRSHS